MHDIILEWDAFTNNKYPRFNELDTVIETGTYRGASAIELSYMFNNVYTIELVREFYNIAKNELTIRNINNVHCYNEDSISCLTRILSQDTLAQPIVFYLDAHSSSFIGVNQYKYADSIHRKVPLLKELEIINTLHQYDDFIIVDDYRLFGTELYRNNEYVADWREITKESILSIFDTNDIKYSGTDVDHDKFIIELHRS